MKLASLKRYSLALGFLCVLMLLMLVGTMGVKSFGDKMFEDANITIHPEGEEIKI